MYAARAKNQNDIRDHLEDAGENLRDNMTQIKDDIQETGADLKQDAEKIVRKFGQQVRHVADTAQHDVVQVADQMTSKVRENPVTSSFIALGVGVILGMFFRRT